MLLTNLMKDCIALIHTDTACVEQFTQRVETLFKQMDESWFKANDAPMSADDLLPSLDRLLPNDITELERFVEKINTFPESLSIGSYAYMLCSLQSAAAVKAMELKENRNIPNTAETITKFIHEFCNETISQSLKDICTKYLEFLIAKIAAFVMANTNSQVSYYNSQDEENNQLKQHPLLADLDNEYLQVLGFYLTLTNKDHDRDTNLNDFKEKVTVYLNQPRKNFYFNKKLPVWIGTPLQYSYRLFTTNQTILDEEHLFCKKVKDSLANLHLPEGIELGNFLVLTNSR